MFPPSKRECCSCQIPPCVSPPMPSTTLICRLNYHHPLTVWGEGSEARDQMCGCIWEEHANQEKKLKSQCLGWCLPASLSSWGIWGGGSTVILGGSGGVGLGNTQTGKSFCIFQLLNTRQAPEMKSTIELVFTWGFAWSFQRHHTGPEEPKTQSPEMIILGQGSVRWRPSRIKLTVNESLLPSVIL